MKVERKKSLLLKSKIKYESVRDAEYRWNIFIIARVTRPKKWNCLTITRSKTT